MARTVFFMALLLALFIQSPAWADGITELGASQIGDNTAIAVEYDINKYNRTITLSSSLPDISVLPSTGSDTAQRIRHNLENRTYWTVHYIPRDRKNTDGALAVFIDSKTGAILGIYTEK